jgi:hypothetical protein
MKKSTRTFLFALFVILFLVVTPAVVRYSQGYRVDWQNKTIVQTGALFLEPRPAPVEVYLNGEFTKKSSFVFQNMYLGNLLPKKYLVEVKKEGYSPWQKKLPVSPKLVSEAKNITLFPLPDPSRINKISENLRDFFPSPSGKYLIFIKNTKTPKMGLYSLSDQREILALNMPADFDDYVIGDFEWSTDSANIIFSLNKSADRLIVSYNIENAAISKPPNNSLSEKVSYDAERTLVARDRKKTLIINNDKVGVYWLEDIRVQPFRNAGDFETIYTANGPIYDAIWFSKNNEYIIFSDKDGIKTAELDSRGERNVHTLSDKPADELFYEPKSELLYFLSNETLYSLPLK